MRLTPGRLLDYLKLTTINLGTVECLVLDEAVRMLDMGFIRDIRKTMQILPKERQTFAAPPCVDLGCSTGDSQNGPHRTAGA